MFYRTWQKIVHETYGGSTPANETVTMVCSANRKLTESSGRNKVVQFFKTLQSTPYSTCDKLCTKIPHLFARPTDRAGRISEGRRRRMKCEATIRFDVLSFSIEQPKLFFYKLVLLCSIDDR
ncbi:hypothetical protein EVAR_83248_1 [Eumeta japonica]|uniref:Uncharacterized protein n=1 Tax=Eumeta variegata TaxID=151549 RepID=A0A4C1Y323_EUMVA|nr:hypothetical protein EVAR_83248_1 [Eumeta japonica]